jgi:hypothetical protein
LTNILVSTGRERKADGRQAIQQEVINLNTELKTLHTQLNKYKNKVQCTNCKKFSHTSERCWILHPELQNQNRKKNHRRSPHTTVTEQSNNQDDDETLTGYHTAEMNENVKDDFLIDSGANVSLTNKKEILHDYEKVKNPQSVTSSNGKKSKVVGKGKTETEQQPNNRAEKRFICPSVNKNTSGNNILHKARNDNRNQRKAPYRGQKRENDNKGERTKLSILPCRKPSS